MRKEACNVVEARERVGRMTGGERRRGEEEVRKGRERYEREVEEYCAWRLPVMVGEEEEEGEQEEEEEEEEEGGEEDEDLPLSELLSAVKGVTKRRGRE
jgi:hypothetical protein